MTMAISKAVEEGAKAVVCASTGNTSASAAAYAARAGLACAVLIPEGYIALGKLAQALVHGARVLQVRGNFDQALVHRARAAQHAPRSPWSTRSTRTASRGRRPGPSRSSTCWATPPTSTASRWATPGTSPPTGAGYLRVQGGRHARPGCPGCSASRPPGRRPSSSATRSSTPRPWPPPSASATRPAGTRPPRPPASPAAPSPRSPTTRSWPPTGSWPSEESVFCEAASAASVAGLLNSGVPAGSTVVCVLTGHGLKDPDLAISQISVPTVVDPDLDAILAELSVLDPGAGERACRLAGVAEPLVTARSGHPHAPRSVSADQTFPDACSR